jgi:virginiamycin B lyase
MKLVFGEGGMKRRFELLKLLLAVSMVLGPLVAAAGASAAPAVNGTFPTTGTPSRIIHGPDGNVWFGLAGSIDANEFGRIAPDGTVTEFDTPNDQQVAGLTVGPASVGGPRDQIWMAQAGAVVRWDPFVASGDVFPVPELNGPRGIVADRDGYIWVVDDNDGLIRLDPATGSTPVEVLVAGSGGRGITVGGDGALWWADFGQGTINRTLARSPWTTTSVAVGGGPQEVAAGVGRQVGFTNQGAFPHQVGRVFPPTSFTSLEVPDTDPFGIALGSDRNYWIANFLSNDLGRLTGSGSYSRPVTFDPGSGPRYVTAGQPGTLWVSLETSGQIARVTGVPEVRASGRRIRALRAVVRDRRLRVSFRLLRQATVRLTVERRRGPVFRTVRTRTVRADRGQNRVSAGRLSPGRYRVRVRATYRNETRSPVAVRAFRIARR